MGCSDGGSRDIQGTLSLELGALRRLSCRAWLCSEIQHHLKTNEGRAAALSILTLCDSGRMTQQRFFVPIFVCLRSAGNAGETKSTTKIKTKKGVRTVCGVRNVSSIAAKRRQVTAWVASPELYPHFLSSLGDVPISYWIRPQRGQSAERRARAYAAMPAALDVWEDSPGRRGCSVTLSGSIGS